MMGGYEMKLLKSFWVIAIIVLSILTATSRTEKVQIKSKQKRLLIARVSVRDGAFIEEQNLMHKKKASVGESNSRKEQKRELKAIAMLKILARQENVQYKAEKPIEGSVTTIPSPGHLNLVNLYKNQQRLNKRLDIFRMYSQPIVAQAKWQLKSRSTKEYKHGIERKMNRLQSSSDKGNNMRDVQHWIRNTRFLRSKRSFPEAMPKKSEQNGTKQDNYCIVMQRTHRNGTPICNIRCNECCKNDGVESTNQTSVTNTTIIPGNEYEHNDTTGRWSACSSNYTPELSHNASSWACVGNIWMIISCAHDWTDEKISFKCQSGLSFTTNKITRKKGVYQVPVFTPDGIVFRNRFCAQCNYYNLFETYKVAFECGSSPPGDYTPLNVREYLFKKCRSPRWAPEKHQPKPMCPKISPPCHKREPTTTLIKESLSRKSRSTCISCKRIVRISCVKDLDTILPSNTDASTTGYNFNRRKFKGLPISLAVPFTFLEEPQSYRLIEFTCPEEKKVYDPYLETCREGVINKPRHETFNSYRVWVFYKNTTIHKNVTLLAFKKFFLDKFSADGVRYFNDELVGKELQFDLTIQKHRFVGLQNDHKKELQLIYGKLEEFLKLNETITIKVNGSVLSIYKVTYSILTCIDLTSYTKHEYALLKGYKPAVFINETNETLSYHNYFISDGGDISVCRTHLELSNCTGSMVPFNVSEYTKFNNHTVFLISSRRFYHRNEYAIIKKTLWLCVQYGKTFTSRRQEGVRMDSYILVILTTVCMSISIIALVFVLITYSLFTELRTPPGINLMNLSVSILLAQLLWLVGSGQTDKTMACTVIAVLLHYFFLVSFVWTSIIAFDTWRAFTAKGRRTLGDKRKRRFHCLRYMAVGWLSILIYEIFFIAIDQSGSHKIYVGNSHQCWIATPTANLYVTVIPVSFVIIWNIVFFAMTVKAIRNTHKQTKLISNNSDSRQHFGIYVRIAVLMGFTWIFAFIAPFGWRFLWYPHVVLNSSQGLYIALAFGLNKRVRKHYSDMYRNKSSRSKESHTSTKMSLLGSSRRKISRNSLSANKATEKI